MSSIGQHLQNLGDNHHYHLFKGWPSFETLILTSPADGKRNARLCDDLGDDLR